MVHSVSFTPASIAPNRPQQAILFGNTEEIQTPPATATPQPASALSVNSVMKTVKNIVTSSIHLAKKLVFSTLAFIGKFVPFVNRFLPAQAASPETPSEASASDTSAKA